MFKSCCSFVFAYNHNKYEELCTTAIIDALTLPSNVQTFLVGGWTVSVKGHQHHNFTLDEAHETNKFTIKNHYITTILF